MFKFLFASCLTLLGTQMFPQQQTITSKGDHNTNANMNGLVNIVVVVDPETKAVLQATAKTTLVNRNLWEGLLVPATDKLPDSCTKRTDAGGPSQAIPKVILGVRAGGNEFLCTHLPCNIVRTEEHELLAIDGKPGAITVEAKVLDNDGDIVVSIEKGRFYVNPNRTYRQPIRNDRSSLKVFDMKGNTALDIRYANRNTLIVQGVFHAKADQVLNIEQDKIGLQYRYGEKLVTGQIAGYCDVEYDDAGHAGFFSTRLGDFFFGGSPK